METEENPFPFISKKDIETLSNFDLGKKANPNAEDLGWFRKFLNFGARRRGLPGNLFGTDAESYGAELRSSALQRELMAELDDDRARRNKKKDILAQFDINNDGTVSFSELPASEQKRRRSEGQVPSKEVNVPALGPTRPLLTERAGADESQGIIPDELGTGSTKASRMGLNPDIEAMIAGGRPGSAALSELLANNSTTDVQGLADKYLRELDPGLQAKAIAEDPDAPLPDGVLQQAFKSVNTSLNTQQGQDQTVYKDQLTDSMRTILQAAGIDDNTANTLISGLPEGLPPSSANNLMSNVTQVATTVMREQQKNQRLEMNNDRQDQRLVMRSDLQKTLQESGKALDLKNNLAVKQVIFEHAEALQNGRLDATRSLSEQRDARQLENRLTVLSAQQSFTREEHELNRAAAYGVQVLRGEQSLDLEGVRQLGRLALADKKGAASSQDTLQKFYLDFMKKNPAVASDMLDVLSQAGEDIDPFTDKALRGALAKRVQEIVDSQVVSDRIRVTADTDIYGNTMAEKMSSLHAAKIRFLQGDPVKGVPPMSPDDLKPIDDQITAMQEFSKAGSPSTNIKVDINEKPMNMTDAAKFSAMRQALTEMDNVSSILFDEKGNINRSVIASSSEIEIPLIGTSLKGLPFTKGRELRQAMLNAIEARMRAETGAAAPESDIIRALERHLPSNLDSDSAVRGKINRLKDYVRESINLVDPVGTQRSRASSDTPVQSLKEPAQQKSFEQRRKELEARGLSEEQQFKQLEQEGY